MISAEKEWIGHDEKGCHYADKFRHVPTEKYHYNLGLEAGKTRRKK